MMTGEGEEGEVDEDREVVPGREVSDGEGKGEWNKVKRKMKRVERRGWKKVSQPSSSTPNRGSEPRARSLLATGEVSRVAREAVGAISGEVDLCNVEGEVAKENSRTIKVDFQVAAVKKPLISVKRICEKGNRVCFGPEDKDNFVMNTKTNKKVLLRPNGKGSYLLDAKFKGGEDISVVVDSGAEENVCPIWWGKQFGMSEPKAWLNFSGANGAKIPHYGKRAIVMESTF